MNAFKYLIFVAAVVLPGLAVAASDVSVEIHKQSSASAKAPAAAPVTAGSERVAVPSTDTKKVGFDSIDGSGASVSAPTNVSSPQTPKSNESSMLALVLLAALSVASIALGAFGLSRSKQLAERLNLAEKALRDHGKFETKVEEVHKQTSKDVGEMEASLQLIKTRLSSVEGASAAQAAPQKQPQQRPAPPAVAVSADETVTRVRSALTAAVRTFVERNVSLSPTQALEQILKYVADDSVATWMRTHNSEHHLIDPDGEPTSNGQLLVIGVRNWNWFVFPRPLSENVPRFSLWFDGDVSKRNVVASKPAVATVSQSGRFELKAKGVLV